MTLLKRSAGRTITTNLHAPSTFIGQNKNRWRPRFTGPEGLSGAVVSGVFLGVIAAT